MAYRLNDYVVYGELRNDSHYSTVGTLVLRGEEEEHHLRLELTGNCAKDLEGKRIRFWPHEDYPDSDTFRPEEFKGFQMRQVGPTGLITAEGYVRMLPCPTNEFLERCRLGEPPPTTWVRYLYIEWYSQNGRVVVEVPGAYVEEYIEEPKGDEEGVWRELPNLGMMPPAEDPNRETGVGITMIRTDASGKAKVDEFIVTDEGEVEEVGGYDEGYEEEDEDDVAELELMDQCLEGDTEVPLTDLLWDLDQFPRPDTLDDEAAEGWLKGLLTRLAMLGITLDVCDHFTPKACYKLLLEEIIPDQEAYEELIGTGWVTHITTWEYCPECEKWAREEYERHERGERIDGPDAID